MNKQTKVKLAFLVILCFVLMCGFTSNKGNESDVETVIFNYMTDKPPKDNEALLTMYESKSKAKYSGFATSDGTSSQIEVEVTADPVKNMTFFGKKWYNCHALVNITTECKEKLDKGQLRVELDSKESQKSENTNKEGTNKIASAIIIGIISAFVLSKITEEREKG
jgi:hypothetical protein